MEDVTREDIIELLKEYKKNKAKIKIKKKSLELTKKLLKDCEKSETKITSSYGENQEIYSKNKTRNNVLKIIEENDEKRLQLKKEIETLEKIIKELKEKIDEVENRLIGLKYKEREILVAYYIDGRTAENISRTLYYEMYQRICTPRYIQKVIEKAINNMLNI